MTKSVCKICDPTLQKIWRYFPTNIGVFLSQIVHPHHISEIKHIDGCNHIHTLLSDKYSSICGCCKTSIIFHDALESFL